jgi:hypothetical protein
MQGQLPFLRAKRKTLNAHNITKVNQVKSGSLSSGNKLFQF